MEEGRFCALSTQTALASGKEVGRGTCILMGVGNVEADFKGKECERVVPLFNSSLCPHGRSFLCQDDGLVGVFEIIFVTKTILFLAS